MMPSISRFLLEGAELLHQDCSSMDRVMMYLEDSLSILHANLSEDNFTRTLDVIWDQLSDLLYKLVESNLQVRFGFYVKPLNNLILTKSLICDFSL